MAYFEAHCDGVCRGCCRNSCGWCDFKDIPTEQYHPVSISTSNITEEYKTLYDDCDEH